MFFLKVGMLHIKLKRMELRAPGMQIICHLTHPWPLEWGKKIKTFFLYIKLKVIKLRAPCKHIVSPYTDPQPVGWVKRLSKNSEYGHVAYQIIGKEV